MVTAGGALLLAAAALAAAMSAGIGSRPGGAWRRSGVGAQDGRSRGVRVGAPSGSGLWGAGRPPWWPAWLLSGRTRAPDVGSLLAALSAELDAGQALDTALEQACLGLDPVPCPRALAAARIGADVAQALRADADALSSSGLRALAACWLVAGRSGAGLSASIQRLAAAQRAAERARGELLAEVATVRASARLLAGLPVVGLLLGIGLGAEPLTWLGSTWAGRSVLLCGLALQAVGLVWMRRIVARAQGGIP